MGFSLLIPSQTLFGPRWRVGWAEHRLLSFQSSLLFYIPRVIDTDQKLESLLPKLAAAEWVAVDTEADSLHAYPEKLCLIQISISGEDILVDPLCGIGLGPLLEALQGRELIMHGADYDLRLLRKTYEFVPRAIFDTMTASRLIGCREFGLTHLVSRFLGIALEKGPQKANWGRRPLTERMETYARNDTRHLKPLSDILRQRLSEANRLHWHGEVCGRLVEDCAQVRSTSPEQVWRVKGSQRLSPVSLAVLREVWHWRESEAIAANKPPYFILPPETMVSLAAAAPLAHPLAAILPRRFSSRRREALSTAIEQGLKSKDPPSFRRAPVARQTDSERSRLRMLEERRDRRAAELGIDPTLIASRATMVLLAKDWAAYEGTLMSWQKDLLQH